MEEFLKSFLEPVSYLLYATLLFKYSEVDTSVRIRNLLWYYLLGCVFLFIGQLVKDNNWFYNLFFFSTVIFLSYFYHSVLRNAGYKRIVLACGIANALLFVVNDVIFKQLPEENNYVRSIYFFTVVIYALLYLYETVKKVNETSILERFEFWLTSGYLLYFLGGLCIVLYYKYPTIQQRGELWMIQSTILFCSCLITCGGTLWLLKQKKMR